MAEERGAVRRLGNLSKREVKFYRKESEILNRDAERRLREWSELIGLYENNYQEQIRDLDPEEMIRVPRFYPVTRQIIASIAFNYPKLFFTIEDDFDGADFEAADVLERAAAAWLRMADARTHVHQAIFDALYCGTGWLRVDYNPAGDDVVPPFAANCAYTEDLVVLNRCPPGFVQADPLTPPHALGQARYIRERLWLPLKYLRDDPTIDHRREIKPTQMDKDRQFLMGEPHGDRDETPEQTLMRESVENGEFVLVDRYHDRLGRRQISFADGVDDPIQVIAHPYANMTFPQVTTPLGQPLTDEDGEPLLDLSAGEPSTGWLVQHGFPFIPVRLDMSASTYSPRPPMSYLRDIQLGITESVSRLSALMKRTARQGVMSQQEIENDPNLPHRLRAGVDGEWHGVLDINNFRELNYGNLPPDQYNLLNILQQIEAEVSRVNELGQDGGDEARTATEAGLIAAASSINREWMEARVAEVYETAVRNAFTVMGDPRYTPEAFTVNVAPDGEQTMHRALKSSDFLWSYRIEVATGSTRPLFEQLQREQAISFFDRAIQMPEYDRGELAKYLASSYSVADPEKLMHDDTNEEAQRAVQLENDYIIRTQTDPGITPGQDHQAHIEAHGQIQQHPLYIQLQQQAQAVDAFGGAVNPQAGQQLQAIDALLQQHVQQHEQHLQQAEAGATQPRPSGGGRAPVQTVQGQVASNAQSLSNQVEAEASQMTDGA